MHSAHQFFTKLAERVGDNLEHAVDAIELGMALGIPTALTLACVAELTELGWIEPVPRPPYAYLPIRLTAQGHELWKRGTPSG